MLLKEKSSLDMCLDYSSQDAAVNVRLVDQQYPCKCHPESKHRKNSKIHQSGTTGWVGFLSTVVGISGGDLTY